MSCVSLCIFPPSLVIPSPSRCHVASALTQGSQFTAESNIGVSGFSLGVLALPRSWLPGQACFLFLPWPAASGRQYPHSDATSLQPPFAGMGALPGHTQGAWLCPYLTQGTFTPYLSQGAGMASFPLPLPAPEFRAPAHLSQLAGFCPVLFFSLLLKHS